MIKQTWTAAAIAAAGALACACEELPVSGTSPPPPPPTIPGGVAPGFTYYGPGDLQPGSGTGAADRTVYAPDLFFPIESHETYLNSQVYGTGGQFGPGGSGWCDAANYQMPWRDNFCERRGGANRNSLNCPSREIHQGQDIRAGDSALCNAMRTTSPADRTQIPVAAVDDGYISYVGSYSIQLRAADKIYHYLHLNMARLEVEQGQSVTKGQRVGYLSNDFNGNATTLHLHFELQQNIDGVGFTWVSPYMSLVRAYERREGGFGIEVSD